MYSRKSVLWVCSLFIAISLLACGEDEDGENDEQNETNQIENEGNQTTAYERPQGAQDFVSDDQLDEFVAAGFSIHGGLQAPAIEGVYLFEESDVLYSDSENYPSGSTLECLFEEEYVADDAPDQYTVIGTGVSGCNYESVVEGNFISGAEGCFTLYGEADGEFSGCEFHALRLFSACLDDDSGDLLDPLLAERMLSLNGDSCAGLVADGAMPDEGDLYILARESGRATLVD